MEEEETLHKVETQVDLEEAEVPDLEAVVAVLETQVDILRQKVNQAVHQIHLIQLEEAERLNQEADHLLVREAMDIFQTNNLFTLESVKQALLADI